MILPFARYANPDIRGSIPLPHGPLGRGEGDLGEVEPFPAYRVGSYPEQVLRHALRAMR